MRSSFHPRTDRSFIPLGRGSGKKYPELLFRARQTLSGERTQPFAEAEIHAWDDHLPSGWSAPVQGRAERQEGLWSKVMAERKGSPSVRDTPE